MADTLCPRPSVTLTFDRLTLKLLCESHLRWGTFIPNLGTLAFGFSNYSLLAVRDGQTDGQIDGKKQRLLPPSLRSGATISELILQPSLSRLHYRLCLFFCEKVCKSCIVHDCSRPGPISSLNLRDTYTCLIMPLKLWT